MAREQSTPRARKTVVSRFLSEPAAIMGPRLMLILSVAFLCIFGLVMVYSASSITAYNDFGDAAYYAKRQAAFLAFGIVLCVILSSVPYKLWGRPAVFITFWIITVVLLAFTAFGMGVSALGAERSILIAGFALQPAEFAKITVLIAIVSIVQMRLDGEIDTVRFIWIILFASVVPLVLIYRQPDLGTAIILAVGIIAVILLAGMPWKIVGIILGLVVLYIVFACVTQPYHLERIISMLDPWVDPQGKGYQSIQSLYAFGSGGIFGTGLGLSRQKYLYLPYAHTDFIFAIVGEELGLPGTVLVVGLFGLFIFAAMRICRNAPDLLGCLLSGSMAVMIVFQACVNMACVTGIAPVTGKALPFISYGGSSMVATMTMVGIILSVSFRSKVGMTYERKRDNLVVLDGKKGARDDKGSTRARWGNVISFAKDDKEPDRTDRNHKDRDRNVRNHKGREAQGRKRRANERGVTRGRGNDDTVSRHSNTAGRKSSARENARSTGRSAGKSNAGAQRQKSSERRSESKSGGYSSLKSIRNPNRKR